ncbi:hypothetical protein C1S82_26830 [Mycolicibacterium cosmeticum]|uniref:CdiI immunity protein domain-containing protein n=1 Tax=Mycolicibacterium cosmeticum TaxID=258533 RepID=W9AVF3_MYCCO|nr:contact-dependent growth inhibition system immunity protein [Mycolicibacterium cosmeticum]TLH68039.1 hypothetical protein C1S82_26830 [Mycolicibacterium cosmeticum]CDO06897.1 hypothetical protein BN977_01691 [Mycolicibacterium cosmeticum]
MTRADDFDNTSWKLRQFFGAYFHEDWSLDANDTEEVVEQYLAENRVSPEQAAKLAARIDQIIATHPESELKRVLFDTWGSYYAATAPETYATWLAEIAARFRQVT